jgi:hypothetical protein
MVSEIGTAVPGITSEGISAFTYSTPATLPGADAASRTAASCPQIVTVTGSSGFSPVLL